jgi:hypothetical protein
MDFEKSSFQLRSQLQLKEGEIKAAPRVEAAHI